MHGIGINRRGEVGPNSVLVRLSRIRGAHKFAILRNGAFTFQYLPQQLGQKS